MKTRKRIRRKDGVRQRYWVGRKKNYGMAWNLDRAKKDARTIQYISPDEYLSRTTEIMDPETFYDFEKNKSRPIKELSKYIKSPKVKVSIPYVGSDPGDHEGRHRAVAARLAGEKKIPVRVPVPTKDRESLGREFALLYRPLNDKKWGWQKEIEEHDRAKWERRIKEQDFPEDLMDLENTKLFKELKKKKRLDVLR